MSDEQGKPFGVLAVISDVSALGTYMTVLELDGQPLRSLDREQALAYAQEMTWAIACAEYDAAVLAQLADVPGLDMGAVVTVVRRLRADRRPILAAATHPLEVTPIVAQSDRKARLTVKCGETGWQWDLDAARQHVTQVLEVSAAVDLDASYLTLIKTAIGLDDEHGRLMVRVLRNFMPNTQDPADLAAG